MFSLITSIVSVVLVAVLAWATLYYGGNLWSDGEAQARAATVVNQGEQIVGAAKLYAINKGHPVAQLSDLVTDGYLSGIPVPPAGLSKVAAEFSMISSAYAEAAPSWVWDAETESLSLVRQVGEPRVCEEVNKLSFSVRGVRDAVDTRLRVQCYGSGAPYTVLWDARVATPPADLPKHPLCLATERINHVPAKCGASLIEDANLNTPTQVSLDGYPNAMGPIDLLPDLPVDTWGGKNGQTCSIPSAFNVPQPAIQFVIVAPGPSALTIRFDEIRNLVSDDINVSYFYTRSYTTRVYVDDQLVQSFTGAEHLVTQEVLVNTLITEGAHVVRLEFGATSMALPDSYGNPRPPESMPLPPLTEVCVSNFKMPLVMVPLREPVGGLPEPGAFRLENLNCSYDAYPIGGAIEGLPEGWGDANSVPSWTKSRWLNYAAYVNPFRVVATKETLDAFDGMFFLYKETPGKPNERIEALNSFVRTGPTTLSWAGPSDSDPYFGFSMYIGFTEEVTKAESVQALVDSLSSVSPLSFSVGLYYVEGTDYFAEYPIRMAGCAPVVVRNPISEALVYTRYIDEYGQLLQGVLVEAIDLVTGQLYAKSLTTSCGAGEVWSEPLSRCVCSPGPNRVCASPNSPLPSSITNTNPAIKCDTRSCTSLPWAPMSGL